MIKNYYDLPFRTELRGGEKSSWVTYYSRYPSGQCGWCAAEAPAVIDAAGRAVARIGKQHISPSQRVRGEDVGLAFGKKATRRANRQEK